MSVQTDTHVGTTWLIRACQRRGRGNCPTTLCLGTYGLFLQVFVCSMVCMLLLCCTGPSRVIPFDLAAQIGVEYAATSPNLLASFVRVLKGESVDTSARATSQAFYVIRGSGESSSPEHGAFSASRTLCDPWGAPQMNGRGTLLKFLSPHGVVCGQQARSSGRRATCSCCHRRTAR